MITDRKSLYLYLDADKFALGQHRRFPMPFIDVVWQYERTLRYYEFHKNNGHKILSKIFALMLIVRGRKLGFSIGANCFGPGLRINHYGMLVVNTSARIGKWCDIHQGVNIGDNCYMIGKEVIHNIPTIGDYVYIAPGAKLYGHITIADEARIGANSVVNVDVGGGMIAVGNPVQIMPTKHQTMTIATPDFEKEFLHKYPQYCGRL